MNPSTYILLGIIILGGLVVGPRTVKDVKKKKDMREVYAIGNVAYGKYLRPQDAHYEDSTMIILYPKHNWECITWQKIDLVDGTSLLKNLYTEKTLVPSAEPQEGITILQQPLGNSQWQTWVFEKSGDNNYLIRLNGTSLYLTATSNKTNSAVILSEKNGSNTQLWTLVRQNPIM